MNDIFSCSSIVLAHGPNISFIGGVSLLIVMFLFVFGLWIFNLYDKISKELFLSSIISYVLVLINILYFMCPLLIPKIILYPCYWAVCHPSYYIINGLFRSMDIFGNNISALFLVGFIIDTLIIFAIIKLILFIKHKVSSKEPQVKQEV
jgi:hypothetical protein